MWWGQRHRFGCERDQPRHERPKELTHALVVGRVGEQVPACFTVGQRQVDVAREAGKLTAELSHERSRFALPPAIRLCQELEKRCIVRGPQRVSVTEGCFKTSRSQLEAERQHVDVALNENALQIRHEIRINGRTLSGPSNGCPWQTC